MSAAVASGSPAAIAAGESSSALRVLTISSVYPNSVEPTYGIFVQNRLTKVAECGEVKVIAPVALVDYSNPNKAFFANKRIASRAQSKSIEVLHPRWWYPPSGGVATAVCLAMRLVPLIRSIRKQYHFNVIDSHFGYPEGIAAAIVAKVMQCPFTVTLRGNEPMHARYRTRRAGIQWALQRAARVITVSENLREFALSLGVAAEKVKTVPNGIDGRLFYPRDRALIRQRLGLAPETITLLSAGYLIERKGHHRVIQAVKRLRSQGVSVRLFIAGGPGREGRFEDHLRQLVAQLGLEDSVSFLGSLTPDGLAEWMAAADLFCLASSREGWPNVVHEAMACGTPVVAAEVGGVADMIPDSMYGIVVPPGDQHALEAALAAALVRSWDRKRIAALAQSRTWDQVGRETAAELRAAAQHSFGAITK